MTDPTPRLRAGDAERDAIIDRLQRAHADGRLDLDEFGERQGVALRARYLDDLQPLVADLPDAEPGWSAMGPRQPEGPALWRQPPASAAVAVPPAAPLAPASGGNLPAVPGSHLPWSLSIMTGRQVDLPPGSPGLRNLAWWGGDNIDVTDAMGPGRTVVLELHAVMGGCTVWVPEGVRIVDESLAIMAGNTIKRNAQGDGSNGTLVLRGFLWWGGHAVKKAKDRSS